MVVRSVLSGFSEVAEPKRVAQARVDAHKEAHLTPTEQDPRSQDAWEICKILGIYGAASLLIDCMPVRFP